MPVNSPDWTRRRFLVVVGGAGSSLMLSGGAAVAQPSDPDDQPGPNEPDTSEPPAGTDPSDAGQPGTGAPDTGAPSEGGPGEGDPGPGEARTEVVEVASGFVDATSWRDELLTLRQGPQGMLVRSELTGRDHAVGVPDGFAGRCLGAHEDLLVIGGHRVVQTGTTAFEAGTPYETLLAQAGSESQKLLAQPGRPVVRPYRHVFIERFPALLVTSDLQQWEPLDLQLRAGTGGSFGAVLERGGVLAADHYGIAEVPDSVIEVSLISLADAIYGRLSAARNPIPLDHGSLWGASDTGTSDLLLVADRTGINGYDNQNQAVLSLTANTRLLGVNQVGEVLDVAVATTKGTRQIQRYEDGIQTETVSVGTDELVRHRISPDVTIATPDGKHTLISDTTIAIATTE